MASAAGATAAAECSDNPLLKEAQFPAFDEVKAADVVPGMTQILKEVEEGLAHLEKVLFPSSGG